MDRDIITRIIEAGAMAPSGSNSQPWEFIVEGNTIFVVAHPEKDHPILNVHERGTLLAIGAAIENITIAASVHGVAVDVRYFPHDSHAAYVAALRLSSGLSIARLPVLVRLADAIPLRATNRKPYKRESLPSTIAQDFDSIPSVRWINNEEELSATGKAAAKAEQMMLENKALHNQLFKEIVWSREEEKERGGGLLVDTMELQPPQEFSFKHIFSKWPVMRILNRIGAAKMVARDNGIIYGQSARMGVIVLPREIDASHYIEAGRTMERIWLLATHHGMSFHIIGGILFLYESLQSGNPANFSATHASVITDAHHVIAKNAKVSDDECMVLLFRIGYGEPPRARSLKQIPRITWR